MVTVGRVRAVLPRYLTLTLTLYLTLTLTLILTLTQVALKRGMAERAPQLEVTWGDIGRYIGRYRGDIGEL